MRWIALVVVCLAMLMNALDASIVNVALPSIQRDLHFTQSDLTWVVNAYLITFGSLLLLAGRAGDLIGRTGVERSFEEVLRGRDGAEFVIVNATGRRVSTLAEEPPKPPVNGHDLVLTIDLKVQRAMEQAMANVARGAGVALDPRDGSVLALVSRPSFDPNEFSHGITWARWKQMVEEGSNPLLDRAIQGVYPPGSTFKVVSMTAALRTGVATPQTRLVPCAGSYMFGGRSFGWVGAFDCSLAWAPRGKGSRACPCSLAALAPKGERQIAAGE